MRFLDWFKAELLQMEVIPGGRYQLYVDNPFTSPIVAVVKEIRSGWVKYQFEDVVDDRYSTLGYFRNAYRQLPQSQPSIKE